MGRSPQYTYTSCDRLGSDPHGELQNAHWWPLWKKGVVEGLVPRFELDTPRVNSEAPIGLIKKTSTSDEIVLLGADRMHSVRRKKTFCWGQIECIQHRNSSIFCVLDFDFGDFGVSFADAVAGRYTRWGGPRLSVQGEPLIIVLTRGS